MAKVNEPRRRFLIGATSLCPCHGSKVELAGRVFENVPAPTILTVSPHQYLHKDVLEDRRGCYYGLAPVSAEVTEFIE